MKLLIGIPARFPGVFLLYLPFSSILWPFASPLPFSSILWPFVSPLPFASIFWHFFSYFPFTSKFWPFVSHVPFENLLSFCTEKILLRQLTFCEFLRCLSCETKSRCIHFVSLLVTFYMRRAPPNITLHLVLFWNTWCRFGESRGLGNHFSRNSSLPLCLWYIMRFSCLLQSPHLTERIKAQFLFGNFF